MLLLPQPCQSLKNSKNPSSGKIWENNVLILFFWCSVFNIENFSKGFRKDLENLESDNNYVFKRSNFACLLEYSR